MGLYDDTLESEKDASPWGTIAKPPRGTLRLPEDEQFSVCQYFESGEYEYVRRYVSAEEAGKAAVHYTQSVAAQIGITRRVIITDAGDSICFEWVFGEGVIFPPSDSPGNTLSKHLPVPT